MTHARAFLTPNILSIGTVLLINLSTYSYFQADKKGTVDSGPKSWASSSGGNEDSPGWTQWIFPVGIALLAAIGYRTVFPGN